MIGWTDHPVGPPTPLALARASPHIYIRSPLVISSHSINEQPILLSLHCGGVPSSWHVRPSRWQHSIGHMGRPCRFNILVPSDDECRWIPQEER